MSKTFRASGSLFTRRSVVSVSAVTWCAALATAGGCDTGEPAPSGPIGVAGNAATAGSSAGGFTGSSGAKSTGGAVGVTGGTATTAGASATGGTFVASAGGGSGGASAGSGGGGSGGVTVGGGGVSSAGAATGGKPCVDLEPPADPEWPDATCKNWATETTECQESWFARYCDVSCGRCTPESSGSGGAGGGSGGAPPKVCMDVPPPEDPEWPGAGCSEWALEAKACSEAWFANYCDVTCGRCTPEPGSGGSGGGSTGAVDCSNSGNPTVNGNEGFATRYWDCCQPHCAQFDGHKCGQDGTSRTGDNTSSCNGGGSFACYDEAPKAVNDCLSYGYIAKANPNCGGCYRIQFTGQGYHNANDPGSVAIKGKQMIVKVSNTGGDVAGNQFDLMIPGGGVGQFNACSRQWGSNDLGAQYGGFLTNCTGSHQAKKDCVRQNCMKIPAGPARDGCLWFVDWFQVADNPKFKSEQTNCPF
ncbi:MAG: hypothetical protein M3020_06930 [Myxococcota bacterium]|jgi:Glycosyl hydrolase family 45|nr:hypothetical protein [Myxococcota bacterium]